MDIGSSVMNVKTYRVSNNLRVKFTNVSIIANKNSIGIHILNMLSVVLENVNLSYPMFTSVSIDVKNSGITLHDVLILKNGGLGGVITLWRSKVTFLGHTVLAQNYGYKQNSHGTLYAYSSTLIFEGNVDFVNNTGYNGGAMALHAGSKIVIGRDTHIKFIGNHAKRFGGAIYVDNQVLSGFFCCIMLL